METSWRLGIAHNLRPFNEELTVLERELKLYIPRDAMPALTEHVSKLKPQRQTLHAIYYDTAERDLALKKAALRIRLEGDKWVQTVKMAGPDELSKIELNHTLKKPTLDLKKYRDHPSAESLFKKLGHALSPRYETIVERHTALIHVGQSTIEIALDEGIIKAGHAELAIREIEFELVSGKVDALFEVGEVWLKQFGLIIELRSKSERGDALANKNAKGVLKNHSSSALALAHRAYRIQKRPFSAAQSMHACYAECATTYLSQTIRNAAFLAGIDDIQASATQQADYLTQMRVGMRRLRSVRRLFRPWMTLSEKHLSKALRHYFAEFGEARDSDLLALEMLPKLQKGGLVFSEPIHLPAKADFDAKKAAASPDFQRCLLRSLWQLVTQQSIIEDAPSKAELYPTLHALLEGQLDNIQKASADFKALSQRRQHRLRNWIKSLRYCLEFLGSSSHTPLTAQLREAQQVLGKMTDLDVTIAWAQAAIEDPEQRGYALGWLNARRDLRAKQAALTLQPIINMPYPPYARHKARPVKTIEA